MNQSIAICRYLGRELKIAGSNNWESLEIDAIVDTIQDLRQSMYCIILITQNTFNLF